MIPTLGWAGLSRSALKRAEAQLFEGSEGVRDEVGVLALHTAYADRFFPGTSVQQSRLRYALFVPWQIRMLLQRRDRITAGQARAALEDAELDLASRLPDAAGEGTIGRRMAKVGKAVVIPPSQSYWVALRVWGILHKGPSGTAPSRAELFERWTRWPAGTRPGDMREDDDKRLLQPFMPLFHPALPEPPRQFSRGGVLDFRLQGHERAFLRTRLLDTHRPQDGEPSLLAALVRADAAPGKSILPWSPSIAAHADRPDQEALHRARYAAALAAIARAAYNAMVEALQEAKDGRSPSARHRSHLVSVAAEYGPTALRLDLGELPSDGIAIGGLAVVLGRLQRWIRDGGDDVLAPYLYDAFWPWELGRKGSRRARLAKSTASRLARDSWHGEEVGLAEPIDYRWRLVTRLLRDLVD